MKNESTISQPKLKQFFKEMEEEKDIYYMSLLTMCLFSKKKKYHNISELAVILDKVSFLNLIKVYGGEHISIPTQSELLSYIQSLYYIYYKEVEGKSDNTIINLLQLNSKQELKSLPIKQVKMAISEMMNGGLML